MTAVYQLYVNGDFIDTPLLRKYLTLKEAQRIAEKWKGHNTLSLVVDRRIVSCVRPYAGLIGRQYGIDFDTWAKPSEKSDARLSNMNLPSAMERE